MLISTPSRWSTLHSARGHQSQLLICSLCAAHRHVLVGYDRLAMHKWQLWDDRFIHNACCLVVTHVPLSAHATRGTSRQRSARGAVPRMHSCDPGQLQWRWRVLGGASLKSAAAGLGIRAPAGGGRRQIMTAGGATCATRAPEKPGGWAVKVRPTAVAHVISVGPLLNESAALG